MGRKLQKSHIRFIRNNSIFKSVPSPTNHREHIGKVLHNCIPSAIQKHKKLHYNFITSQRYAAYKLFCIALKSLTNYSAARKWVFQKKNYTYMHIYNHQVTGCCGIFFYPSPKWSKSCAQTMPFEFKKKQILTQVWDIRYRYNIIYIDSEQKWAKYRSLRYTTIYTQHTRLIIIYAHILFPVS